MKNSIFKYMCLFFIISIFASVYSIGAYAETTSNSSDRIKLYFNDPNVYNKPSNRTESEIGKGLIDFIKSAKETIDFAIYGLSKQNDVIEALKDALDRGVQIRGVVDQEADGSFFYNHTDELIQLIKNVRTDYETDIATLTKKILESNQVMDKANTEIALADFNGNIMHNKFFIVDEKKVWTGSTNVSSTDSGGYNANMACIIENEQVAELYRDEFLQMYEDGLFHNNKRVNDKNDEVILEDGTSVFVNFSPQDSVIDEKIIPLMDVAQKSINIPVFYLTHTKMAETLINAYKRGVEVKIIIDAYAAENPYTKHEILRQAGIPVKVENWGGKMHLKTAIIDDTYLIVGSMNFSNSGDKHNDENTLIIHNDSLAKESNEFFEVIWKSIPDTYLQVDPRPESIESTNSLTDWVDNDHDGLVDRKDDPDAQRSSTYPYFIIPKEDDKQLEKILEEQEKIDDGDKLAT